MATLIKGILSFNLDWQFVLLVLYFAVVMELCGVKSLSFAVGAYLPLSTTLPIFCGGFIRSIVDWRKKKKGESETEDDLSRGNLLQQVLLRVEHWPVWLWRCLPRAMKILPSRFESVNLENSIAGAIGDDAYQIIAELFFW